MLYASINEKLENNTQSNAGFDKSNFSEFLDFVGKSSSVVWNSDKIKNVNSSESNKTIDKKYKEVQMNTIDADTR